MVLDFHPQALRLPVHHQGDSYVAGGTWRRMKDRVRHQLAGEQLGDVGLFWVKALAGCRDQPTGSAWRGKGRPQHELIPPPNHNSNPSQLCLTLTQSSKSLVRAA